MPASGRPILPSLTRITRPFWTGGADGQLLIARCARCGYWIHPPAPVCPQCWSRDVSPQAVSGRGVVYTYTVNYQPWTEVMPPPYVVALIDLDEQPALRLVSNVVGCDPEAVHAGMPVEVLFEPQEDVYLPIFRPVTQP
jgi:uncharacterized protein